MSNLPKQERLQMVEQLGGCCAQCRSVESLELDHIDPWTRTSRKLTRRQWLEHLAAGYLQVLCRECHLVKSREDRFDKTGQLPYWEHGTITGYYAKLCKCGLCVRAMQIYTGILPPRKLVRRPRPERVIQGKN